MRRPVAVCRLFGLRMVVMSSRSATPPPEGYERFRSILTVVACIVVTSVVVYLALSLKRFARATY